MKKILLLIIVIVIIAGIAFASYKLGENNSTKKETKTSQTISEKITYSIDNNMPKSDSKYSKRGVYYDTLNQPDSPHIYVVAMGEKSTGGYSINIETVNIDNAGNVEVIVKETSPGLDSIVTMAITYPTCMITLDKLPNSIIVKNTEGKLFKNINF